ncbi:zinc ABC transporter substrate-binding protein [Roseovarius sp. D22-M7]|uniref:zinc ABC transporter substrate-binding protein n=1 Tax=Roseovarius sp. D22-M7 TaxID=3127116 RepID=UPI00300F887B
MPIRFIATLTAGLALAGAARAEVPKVATDITPVHSLVARVMQGVGEPALIVAPGATPHGYAMRPSEAAALDDADLVIWIGPELTPWLEDAIGTLAGDAHSLALLDAPETRTLPVRTGATFAADAHDAGHDDHGHDEHAQEDHDDHGHDDHAHHDQGHADAHDHAHDGPDPHAWLDPANARAWLSLIAAELADHDPANAARYTANSKDARAEIASLEDGIADRLAPVGDVPFLVFHDAYQYFEAHFGLTAAGAISLSDASDPSAARIAELRDLAASRAIACILAEPQFDPKLVETVFGGVARHGVVDPLATGVTPGPELYPTLMRDMAGSLAQCLGGQG